MSTHVEQQKYNFLLSKLQENQKLINALVANPQSIDIDNLKNNAHELKEQLQQQGYNSTNDIQKQVKQVGQQADNVIKNNAPSSFEMPGKEMFGFIKRMGISMMMMSMMGPATRLVSEYILGPAYTAIKYTWSFIFSEAGAKTIGVVALLFAFGYMIFKIYKKIVDKAKANAQNKAQPTREEVYKFIEEINNEMRLTENSKALTEMKLSVDKQTNYLNMAVNVCQDALDVISMGAVGGGLIYIALTASLAPVMFAAAIGSCLWVILFLTRNFLKNKQKEQQ